MEKAAEANAVAWVSDPNDPNNVKIETAIRVWLNKPTGEPTKVDLERVASLNLQGNKLTDVKGLEKLTQLTVLNLSFNHLINMKGLENLTQLVVLKLQGNPDLTRALIAELQKALPKCKIYHNAKKQSLLPIKIPQRLGDLDARPEQRGISP